MAFLVLVLVLLAVAPLHAIQCAVPISDVGVGNWTEGAGDADASAFDELDEDTACTAADDGDTTYWQSANNPNLTSELDLNLTALTDPVSSTGHTLRWTARKSASAGRLINCEVELRQAGSTIHASCLQTQTDIAATHTDFTFALPASCVDPITDYGDLECVFACEDTGAGGGRRGFVTSCSLEVPDAPAPSVDGRGLLNNPIAPR